MPDQYEVNLFIEGRAYTEESSSLASALIVLKGYEQSYAKCLKIAARSYSTSDDFFPTPQIGLVSSKTGSLDVKTALDIIAVAAPLASQVPAMVQYSLDIYKNASAFIGIATSIFSRTNEPVIVEINNSPGAQPIINVGNGIILVADGNIYDAAKLIHKDLDKMAAQIGENKVDTLSISATDPVSNEETIPISMTEENRRDFKVLSKTVVSDQYATVRCGIYSFNKRSGKGKLDILEESSVQYYPFEIQNVESTLLIDALSANYSIITFNSEMSVNALGESKIKKIYIHDIENRYDDPDQIVIDPETDPNQSGQFGMA